MSGRGKVKGRIFRATEREIAAYFPRVNDDAANKFLGSSKVQLLKRDTAFVSILKHRYTSDDSMVDDRPVRPNTVSPKSVAFSNSLETVVELSVESTDSDRRLSYSHGSDDDAKRPRVDSGSEFNLARGESQTDSALCPTPSDTQYNFLPHSPPDFFSPGHEIGRDSATRSPLVMSSPECGGASRGAMLYYAGSLGMEDAHKGDQSGEDPMINTTEALQRSLEGGTIVTELIESLLPGQGDVLLDGLMSYIDTALEGEIDIQMLPRVILFAISLQQDVSANTKNGWEMLIKCLVQLEKSPDKAAVAEIVHSLVPVVQELRFDNGNTLLHAIACQEGLQSILGQFVELWGDINCLDGWEKTPLSTAMINGLKDNVDVFFATGKVKLNVGEFNMPMELAMRDLPKWGSKFLTYIAEHPYVEPGTALSAEMEVQGAGACSAYKAKLSDVKFFLQMVGYSLLPQNFEDVEGLRQPEAKIPSWYAIPEHPIGDVYHHDV